MPQQPEAVLVGDPVLGRLDHLALELDDAAAAHADQVVVVLVRDLVAGDAVFEGTFDRETRLAEDLHRAVDGREADVRVRARTR